MPLTPRESAVIETQMQAEQMMVKKFAYYAAITKDPKLRAQFETNSAKHQNHYDRLREQLRQGGG